MSRKVGLRVVPGDGAAVPELREVAALEVCESLHVLLTMRSQMCSWSSACKHPLPVSVACSSLCSAPDSLLLQRLVRQPFVCSSDPQSACAGFPLLAEHHVGECDSGRPGSLGLPNHRRKGLPKAHCCVQGKRLALPVFSGQWLRFSLVATGHLNS